MRPRRLNPSGPINYVTAAHYAPHGEVAGYTNGYTSSFNGIITTNTWNNRLQPLVFAAATQGSGSHTVLSLSFSFNQGSGGSTINNGLLVKINNGVNSGRNVNYKYDQLNRIAAAWHDATDWGTRYTLDIWGNLSQKSQCDNVVCPTRTMSDSFSAAVDGNNHLVGYSYDANGNLLSDQLGHSFSYDGENRIFTAAGVTYYYDGEGERVAKSSGKLYWFGTGSAPVAETDVSGNVTAEYVFFHGQRVAMRKADGSVHYYFADQIGSTNVVTNATGAMPPEQDIEYHPYGEQQVYTDTVGQQYKFTGKERDAESGLDNFGKRYHASSLGRFMTPDPIGIMKQKLRDPQQWNMYSYTRNNPVRFVDPNGMYNTDCKGSDITKCSANIQNFDANRQKDLQSKDPAVRAAAAAFGSFNDKNKVDLKFDANATVGKTQQEVTNGKATDRVSVTMPTMGNGVNQPVAGLIAHEGTHVQDVQSSIAGHP
jgi:RHS repeat-associated protein